MAEFNAVGQISKLDDDKRQVFGWASVTDVDGKPVVDRQSDWLASDELERAVYKYVLGSRVGGTMHGRDVGKAGPKQTSQLIESLVITPEKLSKMGLPENALPTGWWAGFQVNDESTWQDVKKGRLKSFSIHGTGKRTKKSIAKDHRVRKLAEVWHESNQEPVVFAKSVALLADKASEAGHEDAGVYVMAAKHLTGLR
jgi:hypothetical protein